MNPNELQGWLGGVPIAESIEELLAPLVGVPHPTKRFVPQPTRTWTASEMRDLAQERCTTLQRMGRMSMDPVLIMAIAAYDAKLPEEFPLSAGSSSALAAGEGRLRQLEC